MRRLTVLLVLLAVHGFAGTETRTVKYDRDDLVISSRGGIDDIELRGGAALIQPGSPRVPRVVEALAIPSGAVPVRVEVLSEEWTTLPGTYKVGAAQPDFPLSQAGKTRTPVLVEPDAAAYASENPYPATVARLAGFGTMAGYRIAHVELHPVRYVPATGELRLATRLTYRLEYAGGMPAAVATDAQRQTFGRMVMSLVRNPGDVKKHAPRVRANLSLSLPSGHHEYVVVTDTVMDTVFQRLADWKTEKGVPGNVVTTDWIYANYSGYDQPERIRNFIKDAYSTWGTMYVLLGGQGDYVTSGQNIVPTRMANCGEGDEPCDLYYAGLDGTWDLNNNHTYGQIADSVDMYADVYVGRAPVYDVATAQNFVSKVLKYEQDPPSGFIKKMGLPTAILWSTYEERPMQESIVRMTPADWSDQRLYERSYTLSRQAVVDSMNAGVGLGHWVGHGFEDGLVTYFHSGDADALVNGDKTGIVVSIGCFCAAWDRVPGGDCFAEHLVMRVGGGCVAAVMNTRYGWGALNQQGQDVPGPSERLDTTFFAGVLQYGMPHTGQALGYAKACWAPYADSLYQYDMQRFCIYDLNLIGDPETPLWTDEPTALSVSHPGVINIGNNIPYSVTVTTTFDAPVESAMVYLKKDDEVELKGWTNPSGQVTLYVSATTPGQMSLAVNARDHYIFCDTVQVIASPRHVCYLRSTILDPGPGGNNDSILNPGETVKIPMWVKNWGQQTANLVTAKLRTYDPNAQITDSAKTFGNIAPGDSAYTGDDGFGLHVNPGLANGYPVTCSLYCKDEFDSTWISVALFLVGTPAIAARAVAVVDTAHGGNNNARIDPDETADLMVMVRNSGMGHGYNCRAVLRSGDIRFTTLDSTAGFGLIRSGDSVSNSADLFTVRADASILPETPIPCTLYYYADGGYVRSEPLTIVVGEPRACEPIPDGPRKPTLYYAYDDTDTLYPAHPTYDWVEVNSVGTILTFAQNDDVVLVPLPPEFGPLKFYGQEFTEISVSADGWISPGNHTAGNCANASLPDPADPPGMICANWDDLYPESGGGTGCVYYHHDTANHRFVIEYDSVQYYFGTNHDKFEVIIYDTTIAAHSGDNAILVQYMTANRYISSTIGIEDPSETIAIQVLYNGIRHKAAAPIAERRAILYTTDPPFPVGMNDGHHPAGVPVKLALDIYPNPVRSRVSIAWAQPAAGRVSVKVYDAAGRVIRDLVGGKLDAGRYSLTWDGLAEDGGRVSDGVYFCQLVTAAGARQHKLILARR